MSTNHGEIHWTELNTWDVAKAKAFYEKTLGWTFEDVPMPDMQQPYTIARKGEKVIAGIFPMTSPDFDGLPDHWMTYFAVEDVEAATQAVKAAGGSVKHEPFDVPQVGKIAIVADSGGGVSGFMTPSDA
ncbi:MAG: VOC family protein [Rhodobacteraceae bacterium]|nr:VOC family protein [Paracoccaceae bacterium]